MMKKITSCLWFDSNAEAAVNFYLSIFKENMKIKNTTYVSEEVSKVSGMPANSVLTIVFELKGQEFIALNGGPIYVFSPAVSFIINCDNQDEIDRYWYKLSEGGEKQQCGWLKDKYGLTWQIAPSILGELLGGENTDASKRVFKAMLQMEKIEIDKLIQAFEQK